jgi:hypothetical protein
MRKSVSSACPCGDYEYTISYNYTAGATESQESRYCHFCGILVDNEDPDVETVEEDESEDEE